MDKYQKSRKDKLFKSHPLDPYAMPLRPGGKARCPQCGAAYHDGEWHWHSPTGPGHVESTVCPACRRIEDRAAAGQVRVSGRFLDSHEDEIRQLMQHTEQQEKQTHVLERLIAIDRQQNELVAMTTGTHLANRIGHELEAAYDGHCSYQYSDSEVYLSVDWHRD